MKNGWRGGGALFDETNGPIGDECRQVLAVHRDPGFVLPEVLHARSTVVMPVVDVTAHEPEEEIEAVRTGAAGVVGSGHGAAEMPLADEGGAVPAVLQDLRQRRAGDGKTACAFRPERDFDRTALWIASTDQRGPRRAAQHAIGIRVGQSDAFAGETIEVWRLDVGSAVAPEIGVPHVVRHDQDHIRTRAGGRRRLLT